MGNGTFELEHGTAASNAMEKSQSAIALHLITTTISHQWRSHNSGIVDENIGSIIRA
jgi:hypothetical protein